MDRPLLVIGNKAYSSWSLRPWLLMRHSGIDFDELRLPLYTRAWQEQIQMYSPTGKVPVLVDGPVTIWDSLAICEYVAEKYPDRQLWPSDPAARAVARAVSAEMHSGFRDLRAHMPMNLRRSQPGKGRTPQVMKEIMRIITIWNDCRSRFGKNGPFLFGPFSIADAMYAPVVSRFITYAVQIDGEAARYTDAIRALPALEAWTADANTETDIIADYEL